MTPFRSIEMDAPGWPELRQLLELACPTELKFVQDGTNSYKMSYGPLEGFLTHLYAEQYKLLQPRIDNLVESLNTVIAELNLKQYLYEVMDNRTLARMNYGLAELDQYRRAHRLPTLVEIIQHELGLRPAE